MLPEEGPIVIDTICGPLMTSEEQDMAIRQVLRNGINGTRFYLHGEPVLVYPDAFHTFTVYSVPSPANAETCAFLRQIGADASLIEVVEGQYAGKQAVKGVLPNEVFKKFLSHVGPRVNATY